MLLWFSNYSREKHSTVHILWLGTLFRLVCNSCMYVCMYVAYPLTATVWCSTGAVCMTHVM
jgi:hypothetical protein